MIVTCKPPSFVSSLSPLLNSHPFEFIHSCKYLGAILTSNLSRTPHIDAICSKARCLTGLLYRNFYHHSSSQTLLTLYSALILSSILLLLCLGPPSSSINGKKKLEGVQHFALKMCLHSWSADYSSLLASSQLPTLSSCRYRSKLVLMFKFIKDISYLPPTILPPATTPVLPSHSYHPLNLAFTFPCSSAFLCSFFFTAPKLWNSLP